MPDCERAPEIPVRPERVAENLEAVSEAIPRGFWTESVGKGLIADGAPVPCEAV